MKLTLTLATTLYAAISTPPSVEGGLRQSADRMRTADRFNDASWKALQNKGTGIIETLRKQAQALEDEEDAMVEMLDAMNNIGTGMSFGQSPTSSPSTTPTVSLAPSSPPVSFTSAPSVPAIPIPSALPTDAPIVATVAPIAITPMPSDIPTMFPTEVPVVLSAPSSEPSFVPSISTAPSESPTLEACGVTPEERRAGILGVLDQVADASAIRDLTLSQGQAAEWIISEDVRQLCPDDRKIIQRWVLVTMYFSTGGEDWLQCFDEDPDCGSLVPFINQDAFLSSSIECEWAGISCNADACVTEIEFELNNLVGVIPTELGLLENLVIWGMERGNLTGTIPSEMGSLENLIFIDLDNNFLTGLLPSELYNLANLTQLDLNNNFLEGDIEGMGVFADLEFLQLHSNLFTGTIPDAVGSLSGLTTFTLHESLFTGAVPAGLCTLVNSGSLTSLIADCSGESPQITCQCCTDCRP